MVMEINEKSTTRKPGRLGAPGLKSRRLANEGPFRMGGMPDNILAEMRPAAVDNSFTPHWINMITPKRVALEGWNG